MNNSSIRQRVAVIHTLFQFTTGQKKVEMWVTIHQIRYMDRRFRSWQNGGKGPNTHETLKLTEPLQYECFRSSTIFRTANSLKLGVVWGKSFSVTSHSSSLSGFFVKEYWGRMRTLLSVNMAWRMLVSSFPANVERTIAEVEQLLIGVSKTVHSGWEGNDFWGRTLL